jgi:hypothetical protein
MNGKYYQLRPKNKSNNSIDSNALKNQSNYEEIITNIFQKQKETIDHINKEKQKNNSEYKIYF